MDNIIVCGQTLLCKLFFKVCSRLCSFTEVKENQHDVIFWTKVCLNLCINTLCLLLSSFNITMPLCTKPAPWKHVFSPSMLWKDLADLHRALNSASSKTFDLNWNTAWKPLLITRYQHWYYALNESISHCVPRIMAAQVSGAMKKIIWKICDVDDIGKDLKRWLN